MAWVDSFLLWKRNRGAFFCWRCVRGRGIIVPHSIPLTPVTLVSFCPTCLRKLLGRHGAYLSRPSLTHRASPAPSLYPDETSLQPLRIAHHVKILASPLFRGHSSCYKGQSSPACHRHHPISTLNIRLATQTTVLWRACAVRVCVVCVTRRTNKNSHINRPASIAFDPTPSLLPNLIASAYPTTLQRQSNDKKDHIDVG